MSKIVFVVQNVPEAVRVKTIARIRGITGRSISEVAQCLRSGEPVCTERLFENDHDEVAARLRNLVVALVAIGATAKVFELAPDEEFNETIQEKTEISTDTLINILDACEEQLRHQQEMWDRYGHI